MSDPGDWRNLRSEWQGVAPDPALVAGVRRSLTWRIWASRAWFVSESLSFLWLCLLIAQKVVMAEWTQALGLASLGGFLLAGVLWARRGRRAGNMESLPGMVDLALTRARTALRLVYGTYAVLLILLLLLFTGLRPPEDQLSLKLAWLAISAIVAVVVHLFTRARIRRFQSIHDLLGRTS
jgi:hypothetical protein